MIVDKFATDTCISRHTLCLIITEQFTTDWRNRDVQRRFFVNCLNFYKRRTRSCLSSLRFLPRQDERWLHFPNCLAVFITDCKRFGLPCRCHPNRYFWVVFKKGRSFLYIYTRRSIRVRDATCGENGPCCVQNVLAPSLVRINIDSFVALVLGKFPCFLEIDNLFILNYKSGTKLTKIYPTGNAMFIPTYNKRTNALVKNLRHCSNMSRRECDLTCLVAG